MEIEYQCSRKITANPVSKHGVYMCTQEINTLKTLRVVHLFEKTCECFGWQMCGYPCQHAYAAAAAHAVSLFNFQILLITFSRHVYFPCLHFPAMSTQKRFKESERADFTAMDRATFEAYATRQEFKCAHIRDTAKLVSIIPTSPDVVKPAFPGTQNCVAPPPQKVSLMGRRVQRVNTRTGRMKSKLEKIGSHSLTRASVAVHSEFDADDHGVKWAQTLRQIEESVKKQSDYKFLAQKYAAERRELQQAMAEAERKVKVCIEKGGLVGDIDGIIAAKEKAKRGRPPKSTITGEMEVCARARALHVEARACMYLPACARERADNFHAHDSTHH